MANVTTIYACTADGLAIFNKPGTLNEWLPPRRVLVGLPVDSVWAEAGPPVRVVAVQSGDLLVSENGGRAWEKLETEQYAVALFPGESERKIYAALDSGLHSSDEGGSSWKMVASLPSHDSAVVTLDGVLYMITVSGILYLIEGESLYIREPKKGTWRILIDRGIKFLAHDEGTGKLYAASTEGIIKSEDAGERWTPLTDPPSGVTALQVVPGAMGKPPALVVGISDGITVSPDGGESWNAGNVQRSVTSFARDPERRDRLYAGTSDGYIFESGNRGQAWTPVNATPLSAVTSLFVVRI